MAFKHVLKPYDNHGAKKCREEVECDKIVPCKSALKIIFFCNKQVSDGGVHSHITHLLSLVEAVKKLGVPKCFVQFFSDGRDTRPTSGGKEFNPLL